MKRLLTILALACAAASSFGATLNPIQLLNPAGSTSGQAIVSTGASSAPAWGNVTASALAAQAANTVVANFTGSSASPTAFAMPSCTGAANALSYASGTGIVCNSAINAATLGGATFASPGAIGGTTPAAATFLGTLTLNPASAGNNQPSTPIHFQSTSSGGTSLQGLAFTDSSGNLQLAPGSGALISLNNSSLTSLLTVGPSNVALASSASFSPTYPAGVVGNKTGSNVTAGSLGEYLSNSTTGTSMTTGTATNCTSISLTAGDWDVSGQIVFNPGASTTVSAIIAGGSGTSATLGATGTFSSIQATLTTGASQSLSIPATRVNVSSTTTEYLIGYSNFGVSTMTCNGYISARRR